MNSRFLFLFILLIVVLFWTVFRLRGSVHTRPAYSLLFIIAGQLNNILIQGIPGINIPTPLGQMNAFVTWILLSLGALEALLYRRTLTFDSNYRSHNALVFLALFNIANIYAISSNGGNIIYSDFFLFLSVFVILLTRPTRADLKLTLHYMSFVVIVNFYCVFAKIRSPSYPFNSLPSYSLPPYRNFTWEIFGIEERYRGPFQHPNAAGAYLALIAIFFLCSKQKYFYYWLFPTFVLLLLCASRTSQIVVILFILIKFILMNSNPGTRFSKYRSMLISSIICGLVFIGPNLDWTGTGRLAIFQRGIRRWFDNPVFGHGRPEQGLIVENSFISTLLISGSIGGMCFIVILVNIVGAIRREQGQAKAELIALVTGFLFGTSLEATFLGTYDAGALYVILLTTILTVKQDYQYKLVPEHVISLDKPTNPGSEP